MKFSATAGGLEIIGASEGSSCGLVLLGVTATENTTKTDNGGRASVEVGSRRILGGGGLCGVGADANIFAVRNTSTGDAVLMVDEDGDFYVSGSTSTFDAECDVALVRAFDLARGDNTISSEWDKFVQANESDLVRIGVLGAPIAERGMTNMRKLAFLHNGAIWQLHTKLETQQEEITAIKGQLHALTEGK